MKHFLNWFLIFGVSTGSLSLAQNLDAYGDAVMIRSQTLTGTIGICSGVLIAPQKVLTASHCVQGNQNWSVNFASVRRGWIKASRAVVHPHYSRERSYSAHDMAMLILEAPLDPFFQARPLCQGNHVGEVVQRVGFGGRNGLNQKTTSAAEVTGFSARNRTLTLIDPQSVSGDSGGPIYALESGTTCLLGIHSTLNLQSTPRLSYNPHVMKNLSELAE